MRALHAQQQRQRPMRPRNFGQAQTSLSCMTSILFTLLPQAPVCALSSGSNRQSPPLTSRTFFGNQLGCHLITS
eukprot:1161554-Pelagomonas_calceolata.AAC.8